MTAKERHKEKILKFLGDPENDYPPRQDYAKLLGITVQGLYNHFDPAELQEIENEAYEIRKKNSTRQRAEVLKSMYSEAKTGNVSAANLFLERTEGKVVEHKQIEFTGPLVIEVDLEFDV
jgi:hypothetical protein